MTAADRRPPARIRIPADVERPDRLLFGLTARQLAMVAVAGVVLWAAYAATRHLVPPVVFCALACPIGGAATLLAIGRVEGQPADRVVIAAWHHLRAPRRLVVAPEGVPAAPSWVGADPGPLPTPLRLPLAGISPDGLIDLGPDGMTVLCRASSVTFSLRTPAEQEALVAGFARWLNSLGEPVQLLVRPEPVDLGPMIEGLLSAAPGLPHPGLESAARRHARFLTDLAAGRTLLRREVLVVLRQPRGDGAAERLRRRADEATSALAAAGVTLSALDGPTAAAFLSRALDPAGPYRQLGSAGPDELITRGVP